MSAALPPVTPMLAVRHADQAIEFYRQAFDAVERFRLTDQEGRVAHAEIEVFGGVVMLAEEFPDYNASPQTTGKTTVMLSVRTPNVDAAFERALAAGAVAVFPVKDQFYGERSGRLLDPFGHAWILSTPIEEVAPAEMQRRFDEMQRV